MQGQESSQSVPFFNFPSCYYQHDERKAEKQKHDERKAEKQKHFLCVSITNKMEKSTIEQEDQKQPPPQSPSSLPVYFRSFYDKITSNPDNVPPPNLLNYGNAAAYVLNLVFSFGIGFGGWFGLETNAELSARYQTLVTPAPWTFSIWSLIFMSQLIFAAAQLLPAFRFDPQIQEGVKFYYMATCGFQIIWTILFSSQLFWLSFLAMLGILGSLFALLDAQASASYDKAWKSFWLHRFPFQIHYAWIVAASVVNFSVALVAYNAGTSFQVFIAVASLLLLIGVSVFVLFVPKKPKFTVSVVLAWATGGIWEESANPTNFMMTSFWGKTLRRLEVAAACTCFIILALTAVRAFQYHQRKEGNVASVELSEKEEEKSERVDAAAADDDDDAMITSYVQV